MVNRVTITIKPEILKKLDKMIDKKTVRNRSHAVENLLTKAMNKIEVDTALIMAGGDGVNLRPITYEMPKALIPIKGRPVLEYHLNIFKKYDIRNIFISVNHMHNKIIEHFGDGSRFGMNIQYFIEESPLGTAGALASLKRHVKNTFVMVNVDTLISNLNIPEIYNFHKREGKQATVLLSTSENTRKFGVVRMQGSSVKDFMEKPTKSESKLVNAGFSIMEPEALKLVPARKFMIEELFKTLASRGQLSGCLHDGLVFDVGYHEGYERAIKEWKQ